MQINDKKIANCINNIYNIIGGIMDLRSLYVEEREKEYFKNLMTFVNQEYKTKIIYPPYDAIFNAFKLVDINNIKVVIIGQDPYYNPNQAHGLSFSVQSGVALPKSLINIYKELQEDLNIVRKNDGDLSNWARQGVFLLNTILTVEQGKPLSHQDKGWEIFTAKVIEQLNMDNRPRVFVLWGNNARKLKCYINNPAHLVIESSHPSPLSAYNGFFGSKPFSRINNFLISNHLTPIDWSK